jgi:ABC-type spermidine/putrescine transport system permease subunit I
VVAGGAVHAGVRAVLPDSAGAGLAVSFWNFNEYELLPGFTRATTSAIFEGCGSLNERGDLCVTLRHLPLHLKFCLLVWAITLVLGFSVAYFLAFHVRSPACRRRCSCCARCRSGPAT